ncbi:MAG: hypothetical protein PVJ40_06385 [Gammaproteobacteria bacterium]|jgi:hypothetical protein
MIIIPPILWLAAWFLIALVVGTFSGLTARTGLVELFFAVFLGGGIALPAVAGLGWLVWKRIRGDHAARD